MKSKKFTAAEKFFISKQEKYEKELKELKGWISGLLYENDELRSVNSDKEHEIELLKIKLAECMKYNGLSESDIKSSIEHKKKVAELSKLLNISRGYTLF